MTLEQHVLKAVEAAPAAVVAVYDGGKGLTTGDEGLVIVFHTAPQKAAPFVKRLRRQLRGRYSVMGIHIPADHPLPRGASLWVREGCKVAPGEAGGLVSATEIALFRARVRKMVVGVPGHWADPIDRLKSRLPPIVRTCAAAVVRRAIDMSPIQLEFSFIPDVFDPNPSEETNE